MVGPQTGLAASRLGDEASQVAPDLLAIRTSFSSSATLAAPLIFTEHRHPLPETKTHHHSTRGARGWSGRWASRGVSARARLERGVAVWGNRSGRPRGGEA